MDIENRGGVKLELDEKIRPDVLGARLKNARSQNKKTQGEVADLLGVARTTIVAIEAGERRVTAAELRRLVNIYKVSESDLLGGARQPLDMEVKYRAIGTATAEDASRLAVASLLNRLSSASVELERLVASMPTAVDLPLILISKDVPLEEQAEDAALALRQRLGIGLGPVTNSISLIEMDLGLRVFVRPLPSRISGAFAYHESHGGFIMLNAHHPIERQSLSAWHEVAHYQTRRLEPVVMYLDEKFEAREDKFCDAFARSFMMPGAAVRKKAAELRALTGKFSVRQAVWMAIYFQVSIEAMIRRMEELRLAPRGSFDALQERRLGKSHINQVRNELNEPPPAKITPRLHMLAGAAFERELLSEQQIAKRLELDLPTVRAMIEEAAEEVRIGVDVDLAR